MAKVKKPLMKAIITLANRYPEPREGNIVQKNSVKLLVIQEKFFEYEDNPERHGLFKALWRLFIVEYEHDPYYRYRIDWILEEISKCDWKSRELRREQRWKEPASLNCEPPEKIKPPKVWRKLESKPYKEPRRNRADI